MSRHRRSHQPPSPAQPSSADWKVITRLLPYLWAYKTRVLLALACLLLAKGANVAVPLVLKRIIDAFGPVPAGIVLPAGLLAAYGVLRVSTALFTELREMLFAKVSQRAVRRLALEVFQHLHQLSLRFHLERQTGGVTRDIERGARAVSSLVSYTLYSILPTLVEVGLVLGILLVRYEAAFALIAITALIVYGIYTVSVTEWRTRYRRRMNELDSQANTRAIDSLLNFETVKYFGNENFEASRYDDGMAQWEQAAIRSQTSLSLLNIGQALIISAAVTAMLWRATLGVTAGVLSLGDLVLINAFMIQLYMPLNFLGVLYREIKQNLADLERMFGLLTQPREIDDALQAQALRIKNPEHGPALSFKAVDFFYDSTRPILHDISFEVSPGTTTAVVGASGAGKSTLARLLFRFYDVQAGAITIDDQDIRAVTQASLRAAIGIVPQDTVLFNDTIGYNIAYGRPGASPEAVSAAAKAAHIHDWIISLPQGYETQVGERGLKLSGGEKQRVAIARTLLKRPSLLIFDEATSALDSRAEQAIQQALHALARRHTTLVIAHRLSTIVDADQILVMEGGRIIERGRHAELLAAGGAYAQLWWIQQRERDRA